LKIVKNAFDKKIAFSENHIEVGWGVVQAQDPERS